MPKTSYSFDPAEFRNTLGRFCTGVVVVTGCVEGEPRGFAAQSFVSLSLDPPLVGISPALTSTSWPDIRNSGHFCINILSRSQKAICDTFARSAGDKYAELPWQAGETGSPILKDVLAWVDCRIEAEHPAGDHTFVIGAVQALKVCDSTGLPLLFYQGRYGGFAEREES